MNEQYIQNLEYLFREEARIAKMFPDDGGKRATAARARMDYESQLRNAGIDVSSISREAYNRASKER